MSQFYIGTTAGSLPPSVPTSFVTDSGTVIPSGNTVNINGGSSTKNTANGIDVIANATGSNNQVVELTNRITGTATTTDGTTTVALYTFPLGAVPGTYIFTTTVVAYNITDSTSAGYASYRTVRTTGAAGVLISANISSIAEEGVMTASEVTNSISGNGVLLNVIGIAGKTINWRAVTTYIFVS